MTIVGVGLLPFAIPLRTPLATARGAIGRRAGFVVRLVTEDGLVGCGEAAPHPHLAPSTFDALGGRLAGAARWLRGADIEHADELLDQAGALGGAVAMGIDMALHDLVARARGVSVTELLGGRRTRLAASALLDGDVAASAAAAAAAGFTVAKLKADGDPDALAATVAAVTRAAPGLRLRLDANGAWDAARTQQVARVLDPARIEWLEQPTPAADLDLLADARARAATLGHRVAADEVVTGPDDVRRIAACGAADVIVVKLTQVGGLRRALATARAARDARLDVVVTTGLETSLGTAAALHLAAVLACDAGVAPPRAAGVATTVLLAGDLVDQPITAGPWMTPPAGAGLGITLRDDAAAQAVPRGGAA